jgi:putative tryptophan/tyrosine transport system substrate-binding protein
MRRRPLCALAALPFAAAVSPSRAQPARARLCVMADVMRSSPAHVGLMRGLAERGWDEGRNLDVESVQPHQDAKQSEELARRLAQRGCNVILTQGLPATLAAQAGAAQTPRVFVIASDPVALGLVATLQRPGGNATGHVTPAHEIAVKQLSLLRELAPAARRIALAFGAGSASMLLTAQSVEAAARPLGLDVRRFPLQGWQDVEAMPSALSREPVDGLLVPFDRLTYDYRAEIIEMANRLRLPAVYGSRFFIEHGGLVSFGIEWSALMVGSADYVARILGGARPAELPVQQSTRFELVVNRHRARALGVTIPQPVLLQATEVIE